MEIFSVIILLCLVIYIMTEIYHRFMFSGVEYECFFSADDAAEGDEIEFTEIVTNRKFLPVPFFKSELSVPKNLEFSDLQSSVTDKTRFVTSFFSLRSFSRVRRTWKVKCVRRGIYGVDNIIVSGTDILGLAKGYFFVKPEAYKNIRITVRPLFDDYDNCIQDYGNDTGDFFTRPKLISDPFFVNGVREYVITDSMRSINWFATAKEQQLMVNKNDYTSDRNVTVILNIQSSPYDITEVLYPEKTEKCIRVCAAVIRDCCSSGKSVRLLCNSETDEGMTDLISADPSDIFRSLAGLTYTVGMIFDAFAECSIPYINDSEIIIISPFQTEYTDALRNLRKDIIFMRPEPDGGNS